MITLINPTGASKNRTIVFIQFYTFYLNVSVLGPGFQLKSYWW
jgi:hypothetical protein